MDFALLPWATLPLQPMVTAQQMTLTYGSHHHSPELKDNSPICPLCSRAGTVGQGQGLSMPLTTWSRKALTITGWVISEGGSAPSNLFSRHQQGT